MSKIHKSTEFYLLRGLPRTKRNIQTRAHEKTEHHVEVSRRYGEEYFDGTREYGYGGYKYDGRWLPVARDIVAHFGLKRGDSVLDIGCAKGYLVEDLMSVCPGLEAFGLDISSYALQHTRPGSKGRLILGDASELPFPDGKFACALSIDVIHNLERPETLQALKELQRVSNGRAFFRVDSYRSEEEREAFLRCVLTAKFHDNPDGWRRLFDEAGYMGDYYWTIIS